MFSYYFVRIFLIINVICFCVGINVVELDHNLDQDAPYYKVPGAEPYSHEIIEASTQRGFWLALGKYKSMEHIGTDIESPYNFYEFGLTVDQIPVEQYFGEASVIDVRDKVAGNDLYEVTVQDIQDWTSKYGLFPNNSFVLFHTGWEKGRYPNQIAYLGDDKGLSNMRFPGVSLEAMQFLLSLQKTDDINITAFGIDAPRLDYGQEMKFKVTALFSETNKYLIKNMRNLEALPPKGAKLIVTPMKIKNAASAPTRVLAILPY